MISSSGVYKVMFYLIVNKILRHCTLGWHDSTFSYAGDSYTPGIKPTIKDNNIDVICVGCCEVKGE